MYHYRKEGYQRRSIRLQGYDYSQEGWYFITICCQDRAHLFGEIINGEMILNEAGQMIESEWLKLKIRFPNIHCHEYVIMPDHFHAILEIIVGTTTIKNTEKLDNETVGSTLVVDHIDGQPQGVAPTTTTTTTTTKTVTVGDIIGAFKSITTVEYIRGVKSLGWPPFNKRLWQRNYYEHIIRNDLAFWRITEYIKNNPKSWEEHQISKKRKK
ncbi:hypothetical protein GCM10010992_04810 [Cloacibacterium rupense]|uniref:Transposase IS200-like domain-containing protein n=1 Tax=Cloacibacterium rupense TaxID=517423 RepID=A0ABQ2NHU8_9FLAO|nr:transposase [Cloacibacterium rupense]GGP02036.1 hypothetical protein GCM10010992_04810 [Cloacibacterium rupense]